MGSHVCCCSNSASVGCVQTIPDPTGQPIDPLQSKDDLMDFIKHDPHIHYFKNQIQGVLMKAGSRGNGPIKNTQQLEFATSDKKQYDSYIQMVNNSIRGNELSTTNVLSHLFKEVSDMREREEVEAKFKNQKYAALKCFVYLYTGNYAYRKVNKSLRTSEYQRLAPIIALVKKELQMFSKENSSLANRNIGLLFRGIDKSDPSMVQKTRLYWKGFTSTALSKEIAKNFGRYQYTIALKRGLPHQYFIIPKELSRFDEEEVLIFPFFYFQVTKVVSKQGNKSESYDIIQMPPENEQVSSENLNESKQIIFTATSGA